MIKSNFFQNLVTGCLLLCAAAVAVATVHREFFTPEPVAGMTGQHVDNWRELAAERKPSVGDSSATLTVLDFSDFECPYCRALEGKLDKLVAANPGKVRIVRYELPLIQAHPHAYEAALASKCAKAQGVERPFEEAVYSQNEHLGQVNWQAIAKSSHVPNSERFMECLNSKVLKPQVDEDLRISQQLGFQSTPTLVLNGDVISGDQPEESLRRLFSRYLD